MCSQLTASAAHSGTFVDVIGGKVRCGERAAPEGSRACTNRTDHHVRPGSGVIENAIRPNAHRRAHDGTRRRAKETPSAHNLDSADDVTPTGRMWFQEWLSTLVEYWHSATLSECCSN